LRGILIAGVVIGGLFAVLVLSVAKSESEDVFVHAWAAVARGMFGNILAGAGFVFAVLAFATQVLVKPWPHYAWRIAIVLAALVIGAVASLWWLVVVAEDPNYPTRDDHVMAIGSLVVPAGLYGLALAGSAVAVWRGLARAARTNLPVARVSPSRRT
jgi:hypothetical protein